MANEIAIVYLKGKTLTADVFQADGTDRQTGISLTENATGGLYLGDCATIQGDDIIVAYEGSRLIGGGPYQTVQANITTLLANLATVDTVVDAVKAKTDTLPADPADASDVAAAISAAHSTTDDLINAVGTIVSFLQNVAEGDAEIDTGVTPWDLVIKDKDTQAELIRKELKDVAGADVTAVTTVIGQHKEP